MQMFASFSSEQEQVTHGMYMTALIRPLDKKKIKPIMFYEQINAKVIRRSIAFAMAVVVTSRSSSFEYTITGIFLQFWEGALGPFRLGKLAR